MGAIAGIDSRFDPLVEQLCQASNEAEAVISGLSEGN